MYDRYFGKSKIRYLNSITMVVCLVLIIAFFIFNHQPSKYDRGVQLDATITFEDDGSKEYVADVSQFSAARLSINFYTAHQKVYVYIDGSLVYSFDRSGGRWSKTVGHHFHFIPIPMDAKQVKVIEVPCYDVVRNDTTKLYIGESSSVLRGILVNSLPKFIASFGLIMVGIGLVAYYIFVRYLRW